MSHGLTDCVIRRAAYHCCPMFFMRRSYPELCPTRRGRYHQAGLQRYWRAPTRCRAIFRRRQRRRHTRLHITHVDSPSPPASRRARSESRLIGSRHPNPPGALTLMQTQNSPIRAFTRKKLLPLRQIRLLAPSGSWRNLAKPSSAGRQRRIALLHCQQMSNTPTARILTRLDRQCMRIVTAPTGLSRPGRVYHAILRRRRR